MTDTTTTQNPPTTLAAPTRGRSTRLRSATVVATLALGAIGSTAASASQAGSREPAGDATTSADAMERRAESEGSRLTDACRETVVAPDALERCITERDG